MDNVDQSVRVPQDIGKFRPFDARSLTIPVSLSSTVAIFHASFHPTKGNVVDWCLKASDGKHTASLPEPVPRYLADLQLDGVEFSTLPSGLHLVDQDVVCVPLFHGLILAIFTNVAFSYFTKDNYPGVCVFRRRRTTEHGQRGFRLSSLGILLVNSPRTRPWRHMDALKTLVDLIYSSVESRGVLEPVDPDWEPAAAFFEERKLRRADLGGAGGWHGWSHELDNVSRNLLSIGSAYRRRVSTSSMLSIPRPIRLSTSRIYCAYSAHPR